MAKKGRTNVCGAAVQNRLVAPAVLADGGERLYDAQAEFLPLLGLVDGNVLDMPDEPEPAQELALEEDGARADDTVRLTADDDERVVGVGRGTASVELRAPGRRAEVGCLCEHGQHSEVSARVVRRGQRAELIEKKACQCGLMRAQRLRPTWRSAGRAPLTSCEMRFAGKKSSSSESGVNGIAVLD